MGTIGRYIKAYSVAKFREFPGWTERPVVVTVSDDEALDDQDLETARALTPNDYLFLHDNLVVTSGIAQDEQVVFDAITDEWKAFCAETLEFVVPEWITEEIEEPAATSDPQPS